MTRFSFIPFRFVFFTGCLLAFNFTQAQCPVMTSSSAVSICSGASVGLSLTADQAGSTFIWQAAANGNVTGETTAPTSSTTINNVLSQSGLSNETVVYQVTPSFNGCTGATQTVTVTIKPIPNAHGQNNVTLCDSTSSPEFFLNGDVPNTVFTWANNQPGIGLASTGTGDILPALINISGNQNVVMTITVTPSLNGCVGANESHTITVLGNPTMNPVNDLNLCNELGSGSINFSGTGTSYTWANTNASVGLPATGTGNISSFIPTNTGSFPIVATVNVTPVLTSAGTTCLGTPESFNITVNPNGTNSDIVQACTSYAWFGQSLTQTGVYIDTVINAIGCLQIETIDLTITDTITNNIADTVCDFILWNGIAISQSGVYNFATQAAQGCDSLVTLNVLVKKSSSSAFDITQCGSYFWPLSNQTYTQSGNYSTIIPNTAGCDSTITLNLTVNSVDNGVTISGATLTSAATGSAYQWLDCSNSFSPINGETSASFTAATNGSYAVMVTNNTTGCSDTSDCVVLNGVGISEQYPDLFHVFPNPGSGLFTVTTGEWLVGKKLVITDSRGRTLRKVTIVQKEQHVDLHSFESGVYFLSVDGFSPKSVIKH
jgi:hypothetical protein